MKILERKALADFFNNYLADGELIAPVEIEGRLYFRQLDEEKRLAELVWPVGQPGAAAPSGESPKAAPADALTVNSIKEFFFPRRQELYEQTPEGITSRVARDERQRLLLFARPCDTRGLTILDRVFLGQTEDQSYRRARQITTIIGLHCLKPDRHCFCTSLGGGPFDTEGMDLALTPLDGERFVARGVSEKGEKLLSSLSGNQAGTGERKRLEQLRKAAEAAIRRRIEVPDQQAMAKRFDSPYWGEVSKTCLSCGICSYLCPTCHCFDIVDEGYLRVRCWDTCSSDTFTRMAAGQNPRKHKYTRYRQRIYHKFSYFKENFDTYSCVGCGRCTRHCPVKIDIAEIVNGMASASTGDPAGKSAGKTAAATTRPVRAGTKSTDNGAKR